MRSFLLACSFIIFLSVACHDSDRRVTQSKDTMLNEEKKETNPTPVPGQTTEIATLGAGCFWCIETLFQDLAGVSKVESGYTGGQTANPTYREICNGNTGHAEVIRVTFDPAVISYREICDIFFTVHDPTTLNRQGADVGTQYRSAIFYHSAEQKNIAEASKAAAAAIWDLPVVTEITQAEVFYKAEDYHQNYYKQNPIQGYCRIVIAPKVKKFRQQYLAKLKS